MSSLQERFNRPVVAILVITAVTGILRFWDLGHPSRFVFDEVYYAKAGCILIGGSDRTCFIRSSDEHYWVEHKWDVGSWVHPPLGKWMTGLGIKAFGMDAFGWRFASAVAGTLVATFVALIAYLLFGSVVWTYVAGLLVAVEHLNHVQARVALLDVHLEFWVVLGFLFLVLDRRWIDRRTPDGCRTPTRPSPEATSHADAMDALGFGDEEPDLSTGGPHRRGGRDRAARREARAEPDLAAVAVRGGGRVGRVGRREMVGHHRARRRRRALLHLGDEPAHAGRRRAGGARSAGRSRSRPSAWRSPSRSCRSPCTWSPGSRGSTTSAGA